ncbi:MAG: hypothetical protein IJB90_03560 [Clostridia bacterium]|nr:hypothetical protein [Clostridia bacterium]
MEKSIVERAIGSIKECNFNCMPMPEFREKEYRFEDATKKMVADAGYELKWLDTFKGGCWHVIPIE